MFLLDSLQKPCDVSILALASLKDYFRTNCEAKCASQTKPRVLTLIFSAVHKTYVRFIGYFESISKKKSVLLFFCYQYFFKGLNL
jgi:hypothetical protein